MDRINDSGDRHKEHTGGWGKFVFLGGTEAGWPVEEEASGASTEGEDSAVGASLALAAAKVGDRLRVVKLPPQEGIGRRLISMGITLGTELEVISSTPNGSVTIALQDNRVGLGAAITREIRVSKSREEKQMNANATQLRNLAEGSKGRVIGYEKIASAYKKKLLAMGLTKGTEFTVTRHAPLGDPVEIKVRGFSLSLRKQEADALQVEAVE